MRSPLVVVCAGLFWTAPEILRNPLPPRNGTQKADVYSVGILLYNILYRLPPFHTDSDIIALPRGIAVFYYRLYKQVSSANSIASRGSIARATFKCHSGSSKLRSLFSTFDFPCYGQIF